jgi:hypothetical protein
MVEAKIQSKGHKWSQMRNFKKNINFFLLILVAISTECSNQKAVAQTPLSYRTTWKPVNSSMSDLLNSGWKMIGQGSDRAATPSIPGSPTPGFDEQTFTYSLYRDGKYITCIVVNPRPDNTFSRCRMVN